VPIEEEELNCNVHRNVTRNSSLSWSPLLPFQTTIPVSQPVFTCRRGLVLDQAVGRRLSPRRHSFDFSPFRMVCGGQIDTGKCFFLYRIHSSINNICNDLSILISSSITDSVYVTSLTKCVVKQRTFKKRA